MNQIKYFFHILKLNSDALIPLEELIKVLLLVVDEDSQLSVQLLAWILQQNL